MCFSVSLLSYFGSAYTQAYQVVYILVVANLFFSALSAGQQIVVYSDGQGFVLLANLLDFSLLIGLGIVGAVFYGYVGVAYAVLVVAMMIFE